MAATVHHLAVVYFVVPLVLLQVSSVRPAMLCMNRRDIPEANDFGNQQVNLEVVCYGNGSGQFSWSIDRRLIDNFQIEYNCSDPDTETVIGVPWGDPEEGTVSFSVPWDVNTSCVFTGCYEDYHQPWNKHWIPPTSCPADVPISTTIATSTTIPTPTPLNMKEADTDVPISTKIATSSVSIVVTTFLSLSSSPTPIPIPHNSGETSTDVVIATTVITPTTTWSLLEDTRLAGPVTMTTSHTPATTPSISYEISSELGTLRVVTIAAPITFGLVLLVALILLVTVSWFVCWRQWKQDKYSHKYAETGFNSETIDPKSITALSSASLETVLTPLEFEKKGFEPPFPEPVPSQDVKPKEEITGDTASESSKLIGIESKDNAIKATPLPDADPKEKVDDANSEQSFSLEGSQVELEEKENEEEEIHLGDVDKEHHFNSDSAVATPETDKAVNKHFPQLPFPPNGYVSQELPCWSYGTPFHNDHMFLTRDGIMHGPLIPSSCNSDKYIHLLVDSRDSSGSGYIWNDEGTATTL